MPFGVLATTNMFAIKVFNIELIGINGRNGKKLLFTLILVALVYSIRWAAMRMVRRTVKEGPDPAGFWSRQGIQLAAFAVLMLGIASIWINPGTDISTGIGLLSAGLAFALQKLITAFAGYFVILRGDTFNVGDRITMGGVRGDVIRLGFIKTTIMEMGQPPSVDTAEPAMWIHSRQYTGRLVTVSNGKIFDEPVYNYSRDFPYIWEEIVLPITYEADRAEAERVMLAAANKHAVPEALMSQESLEAMKLHYSIRSVDLEPTVYLRITDNWLELALRFVVPPRGVRTIKDLMTREILSGLEDAGITIASASYNIVGVPDLDLRVENATGQPDG